MFQLWAGYNPPKFRVNCYFHNSWSLSWKFTEICCKKWQVRCYHVTSSTLWVKMYNEMLSHLWVTLNLMKTSLKLYKTECEFWRKHAIIYYCYTFSWNFRDNLVRLWRKSLSLHLKMFQLWAEWNPPKFCVNCLQRFAAKNGRSDVSMWLLAHCEWKCMKNLLSKKRLPR